MLSSLTAKAAALAVLASLLFIAIAAGPFGG
ncbi:MAG: hypothetical protein QOH47_2427 [Sphingomonadales bacterium]|jgi:hypothetical protein|nr:hypothetical protein [Sphingomonadales bacterium]